MDGAGFQAPQYPGLAGLVQPYLSWRERQSNESRLADLLLPKALPEYLQGLAYGTLPQEAPFTSWRSTAAYGLPAAEILGYAPGVGKALQLANFLATSGRRGFDAMAGRLIPPHGQFNMFVGPYVGIRDYWMERAGVNPIKFSSAEQVQRFLQEHGLSIKPSTLQGLSGMGVDVGDAARGSFNVSALPEGGYEVLPVQRPGNAAFTPYSKPKYDVNEVMTDPNNFYNQPFHPYPQPKPEFMGRHGVVPNGVNAPAGRYEVILDQANPATRAAVTEQLKSRGLRGVQITDGVIRDEIARRNAATMLELPASNTAADRAAAMGFDTPAYHGTKADITSFQNRGDTTGSKSATQGYFFSSEPKTADEYADLASKNLNLSKQDKSKIKKLNDAAFSFQEQAFKYPQDSVEFNYYRNKQLELYDQISKLNDLASGGAVVYPVNLRMNNPLMHNFGGKDFRDKSYYDLTRMANKTSGGNAVFQNTVDNSAGNLEDIYFVSNPNNIRSRFAAFDPARAKEADILAGVAGATVGLPTLGDMLLKSLQDNQ